MTGKQSKKGKGRWRGKLEGKRDERILIALISKDSGIKIVFFITFSYYKIKHFKIYIDWKEPNKKTNASQDKPIYIYIYNERYKKKKKLSGWQFMIGQFGEMRKNECSHRIRDGNGAGAGQG